MGPETELINAIDRYMTTTRPRPGRIVDACLDLWMAVSELRDIKQGVDEPVTDTEVRQDGHS